MVFCTYCGQQFHRNEHLERHLATHTNVKPFKCSLCHVSFARGDVLQKHLAIHGDTGAKPPRARPRTQTACRNCAKMKAKCDTNAPCTRCRVRQLVCDRRSKKSRAVMNAHDSTLPLGQRQADVADSPSPVDPNLDNVTDIANPFASNISKDQENYSSSNRAQTFRQPTAQFNSSLQHPPGLPTSESHDLRYTNQASANSFTQEETNNIDIVHVDAPESTWPTPGLSLPDSIGQLDNHFGGVGQSPANLSGDVNSPPQELQRLQHDASCDALPHMDHENEWDHTSLPMHVVPEHPAIIEAQDYWSSFCCNPRKDRINCPRTAGVLLEELSRIPDTDELWTWLGLDFPSPLSSGEHVSMPLLETIRDRLSAISQLFLQKALDVHQLDPVSTSRSYPSSAGNGEVKFLALPPSATLEHFLREYMRHLEPFYSLLPGGLLDANSLMSGSNSKAATLLILLMISQGAISDSTSEARRLSGGLIEVCRVALFEIINLDVPTCHNHILVHSAFLFVSQAAWSGDKWLMDIGPGQRGIFLAILKNSGLFDIQPVHNGNVGSGTDWALEWEHWVQRERLIRLTYAWIMQDLELTLFLDLNPLVPVTELNSPLPGREDFWLASDFVSWRDMVCPDHDTGSISNAISLLSQPSLRTLFQLFLNDELDNFNGIHFNTFTLRVLLYPIHSLVHNLGLLFRSFGDRPNRRSFTAITQKSTQVRIEEVQCLLLRWFRLYKSCREEATAQLNGDQSLSPSMITALITYHVIYLNTVTSFPDIECLARDRLSDAELRSSTPHVASRYVQNYEEAVLHSGQILHLLRTLENKARPPWWPAALYRATLILWACSALHGTQWNSPAYTLIDVEHGLQSGLMRDDMMMATTPRDMTASSTNVGSPLIPALTGPKGSDSPVILCDPTRTLETCLSAFRTSFRTRFSDGMHRKLWSFLQSRYLMNREQQS